MIILWFKIVFFFYLDMKLIFCVCEIYENILFLYCCFKVYYVFCISLDIFLKMRCIYDSKNL